MNRSIVAVVDDMFFSSKIRATAEALGIEISFPRTKEALTEKVRNRRPDLLLVDLHNQRLDPIDLVRSLKADEAMREIPVLGFFSHVQAELQQEARTAGYDQVMPRSVFARDLGKILSGE